MEQNIINSSVRSICRLHRKLVFMSSAAHCVATAHVLAAIARHNFTKGDINEDHFQIPLFGVLPADGLEFLTC
jgi:hypothetical protein